MMSMLTLPGPPWDLPDDKLLAQCKVEFYTAHGPGGQHRNKTSAAVRITHLPSGISAVATDSRSQRENRIHSLRNLRHKLALEIRHEVDLLTFREPAYLAEYPGLHMSPKNPLYPRTMALVLDVIAASRWNVARAAVMLGVSTSALVRFLHDDAPLWTHVRLKHQQLGLKPLRWE